MDVNIQEIYGNWNLGYSLDKHVLSSVYIGENQWGHADFDTTRSDSGESLYQLKYKLDYSQVEALGGQLYESLAGYFPSVSLIIPMPPSKTRTRQPVTEISRVLASKMGVPCYESLLVKTINTPQMKDIESRDEKVETLVNSLSIHDHLGEGVYDILIIDDLYDSGSSLEAATTVLRGYDKIQNIFVATVTRKR